MASSWNLFGSAEDRRHDVDVLDVDVLGECRSDLATLLESGARDAMREVHGLGRRLRPNPGDRRVEHTPNLHLFHGHLRLVELGLNHDSLNAASGDHFTLVLRTVEHAERVGPDVYRLEVLAVSPTEDAEPIHVDDDIRL